MKKATKGTLAIAAGITLLMGGAGSLAYWQDSAAISGATVTTGELDVAIIDGCEWTVAHKGAGAVAISDIENFRMVPGDTVKCSVDFTTTATGDNLAADAAIGWGALGILPTNMTSTTTGTYDGASITGSTFAVAKGSKSGTLDFSLVWPFGTAGSEGVGTMNQGITLADSTVTVTQK
ncbi:alternate-type signal peptide domain-containing protein [Microbacterium sp. YMB-B2]|uniref:Alternate-type signal peptide domain-containing protein n=1 Tax=Microbacterium tenebrionis TaxID=2830665 RepID=A0A9X1LLP6_9MICO|nr:alternate-type signal peptide domain-containing protein [Microbacterium tenebrionis]MCC2027985.1 alternate-type signal peptide domain-containing protein [Microbacterium tenebrionis]